MLSYSYLKEKNLPPKLHVKNFLLKGGKHGINGILVLTFSMNSFWMSERNWNKSWELSDVGDELFSQQSEKEKKKKNYAFYLQYKKSDVFNLNLFSQRH